MKFKIYFKNREIGKYSRYSYSIVSQSLISFWIYESKIWKHFINWSRSTTGRMQLCIIVSSNPSGKLFCPLCLRCSLSCLENEYMESSGLWGASFNDPQRQLIKLLPFIEPYIAHHKWIKPMCIISEEVKKYEPCHMFNCIFIISKGCTIIIGYR